MKNLLLVSVPVNLNANRELKTERVTYPRIEVGKEAQ